MNKTILVTGGNGFLGSYICHLLAEKGYRVVSYDMSPLRKENFFIQQPFNKSIIYFNGQITDLSRVITICKKMNVNIIVHTAAFVNVESSIEQPYFTYKVNSEGAIVIYEAARLLNIKRVVLISSNAVYQKKEYEPIDENHSVFSPNNGNLAAHYGASKLVAEIIGLTYCSFNKIDLIVLRMSSIYGFGMQNPMYIKPMVENAVLGSTSKFSTGSEMKRDYTYVKDSAKAVLKAIEVDSKSLAQRVFNISGEKLYSAREVANIVKDIIPASIIEIGSGLSILEQSDIKARGVLDCTKAKKLLGYNPEYTLREGMQDYANLLKFFLQKNFKEDKNEKS